MDTSRRRTDSGAQEAVGGPGQGWRQPSRSDAVGAIDAGCRRPDARRSVRCRTASVVAPPATALSAPSMVTTAAPLTWTERTQPDAHHAAVRLGSSQAPPVQLRRARARRLAGQVRRAEREQEQRPDDAASRRAAGPHRRLLLDAHVRVVGGRCCIGRRSKPPLPRTCDAHRAPGVGQRVPGPRHWARVALRRATEAAGGRRQHRLRDGRRACSPRGRRVLLP